MAAGAQRPAHKEAALTEERRRWNPAALGRGTEDGEAGEELEEATAARAEGAVEGGGDKRTPLPLRGGPAAAPAEGWTTPRHWYDPVAFGGQGEALPDLHVRHAHRYRRVTWAHGRAGRRRLGTSGGDTGGGRRRVREELGSSQGGAQARWRWRRVGGELGGAEPGEAVGGGAWSWGGEPGQGVGGGGPEWRRRQAQGEGPSQEPHGAKVSFGWRRNGGEREMKQRKKMGKRKRIAPRGKPRGSNIGQNRFKPDEWVSFVRY